LLSLRWTLGISFLIVLFLDGFWIDDWWFLCFFYYLLSYIWSCIFLNTLCVAWVIWTYLIECLISLTGCQKIVVWLLFKFRVELLLKCCHLLFYIFICKAVCSLKCSIFYLLLRWIVFLGWKCCKTTILKGF